MATVFFIHLRKTGGTSIMQAANEQFSPSRTLMFYGPRSQWTSPAAAEIMFERKIPADQRLAALSDYIVSHDIAFFSSHLSAARLGCFDPARAFTILRDPVERVISQYYFFRKKERTAESLEDFIQQRDHRNEQARALAGVDLEALAVVGTLEHFEETVALVNKTLGLQLGIAHRKRGGLLKDVRAKLIGAPMRRRIEELNSDDVVLYRKAVELAARRQS